MKLAAPYLGWARSDEQEQKQVASTKKTIKKDAKKRIENEQ